MCKMEVYVLSHEGYTSNDGFESAVKDVFQNRSEAIAEMNKLAKKYEADYYEGEDIEFTRDADISVTIYDTFNYEWDTFFVYTKEIK